METKKTNKANLEKKRVFFLQIGLIFALAVVLTAFEWTTAEQRLSDLGRVDFGDNYETDIVVTKPKPKPKPKPPKVFESFVLTDDDELIEDELIVDDMEWDENDVFFIENNVVLEKEVEDNDIHWEWELDTRALFPGGAIALEKYIKDNAHYPSLPHEEGIEGTVYIYFVVNKKGKVENVRIERGVDYYLDKEAQRVIKSLPDWSPAIMKGKIVNQAFIYPIHFKLID